MMIRVLFALTAAAIAVAMVFLSGWLSEVFVPGFIHIRLGAHTGWIIAVVSGLMGGLLPIAMAMWQKQPKSEPRMVPKLRNGQIG